MLKCLTRRQVSRLHRLQDGFEREKNAEEGFMAGGSSCAECSILGDIRVGDSHEGDSS